MLWANEWSEEWHKRFALFPETISDGRTVWLTHFMERYVEINKGKGCECGSRAIGKWERKLPNEISY